MGLSCVIHIVAIQLLEVDGNLALLHGLPLAPSNIGADGLAFGLGEGAHKGQDQFRIHVQGVDVLLFEVDADTQLLQHPDVLQAIDGISGEPGDGFREDQVDLLLTAFADHAVELLAFLRRGTCDALIGINTCHGPFRVGHNFVRVVTALGLIAGLLLLFLRGYPAVGRNLQLTL